ncbi:MAG: uracil-DNA glycosylase [Pseudomonadota bacterium]
MTNQALWDALSWQVDLGATEAIGDTPVDRFALGAPQKAKPTAKPTATPAVTIVPPAVSKSEDHVAVARELAQNAATLEALYDALAGFEGCELKRGARSLVFSDGTASARVMIVGEAPGRDEDIQGKPFVGRAGQMLDAMFAAIGLSRNDPNPQTGVYITNVLPWRPPQNRDPKPDEIAMMVPFVERHIQLVDPDILIAMGNISCSALLGKRGITRLRGQWDQAWNKPVLPMFHPAYLLRQPSAKRDAWADLLSLKARLADG